MILILTNSKDVSSDLVEGWLLKKEHRYLRLNSDELLSSNFFFDLKNGVIEFQGNVFDLKDTNIVWFRKFGHLLEFEHFKEIQRKTKKHFEQLRRELYETLGAVSSYLFDRKWLTRPELARLNKFGLLQKAHSVGLDIPDSYILSDKLQLERLLENKRLITKSIFEITFFEEQSHFFSMFTNEIACEQIDELPSNFTSSFVQERIEKKYEIRTFYIEGSFYSMAIFSQEDDDTMEDFRKGTASNINRTIPYNLPKLIEEKINALCKLVGLNCCSIDLIKGVDDNYYFLEINPVGQFGMVGIPMNYNLHKIIAEKLIQHDG